MFTATATGMTTSAAHASQTSTRKSITAATPIMTTTPSANGSGLKTPVAASTSEFAFDRSCPAGCERCHDIGRRRYWRVTAVRWRACSAAYPLPAKMRRAATLTASESAIPASTRPATQMRPRAASSPASAGTTTSSVTRPTAPLTATVSAPNSAEDPIAST
ncbi:Uncharacterised protein [Mycobacteroides abscessus]|nr:Uncharacterised protein [Mycobacteroides abscessus]